MQEHDKPLSDQERIFVAEYLVDFNGAAAARRAGYAKSGAATQAKRLLRRAQVTAALAEAVAQRLERTEINADWVLREAVALYQRCIGELKPVTDRRGRPVKDEDGNPVYRFDSAVAARCLEIAGRHVSVNAFQDNVHVTGHIGLAARLSAGRDRDRSLLRREVIDVQAEPVAALPAPIPEAEPAERPARIWKLPRRQRKPRIVIDPTSNLRKPRRSK